MNIESNAKIEGLTKSGTTTLGDSGYGMARLGLIPCVNKEPEPRPVHVNHMESKPATSPDSPAHFPERPHWRMQQAGTTQHSPTPVEKQIEQVTESTEHEEYVRVTVKIPKVLREFLRSCSKRTHTYQYVLVTEALEEFLIQLPEELQQKLADSINKKTPPSSPARPKPQTGKSFWSRWFGR
mgnify:CR=1 FL=1